MKPKLLETIRRLGLTVEEAAQRAGISRSQLYNIQKGRRNLSSYRIATFAKAWGVPEHELVEFEQYHTNKEQPLHHSNRVSDYYPAPKQDGVTKQTISADAILHMRKLVCLAIKARALRLSDEQIDLYTVQACDVFMATGFSALRPSFVDAFMDEVQAQQ